MKPSVMKLYDFTKGGTDVVDQRIGKYSTKPKSPKWTRVCFSYVLDTIRVNASTVLCKKLGFAQREIDSFDLGWDLAEALVMPFAQQRSLVGLSAKTRMKVSLLLGVPDAGRTTSKASEQPTESSGRKRCHACIQELVGEPGYKEEKNRLPKIKTTCSKCGQATCGQHLVRICMDCA